MSLVIGVEEPNRSSCNDTNRDCLALSAIMTIMPSMPNDYCKTTLRPTAHGDQKDMVVISDFDFSLNAPPAGVSFSAPLDAHETITKTWGHSFEFMKESGSTGAEYLRAWRSQRAIGDDYGAAVGREAMRHLSWLYDPTYPGDRVQALAAMVTYGKDIYDGCYNGGVSQICEPFEGAGQGINITSYAFLYAAMLNDKGPGSPFAYLSTLSAGPENIPFVPDEIHKVKNVATPVWGDTCSNSDYLDGLLQGQCFDGALGNCVQSGGGSKKCADPTGQIDGQEKQPGTSYFAVTAGGFSALAAMMELEPRLKAAYNYPPITAYAKRIYNAGVHTLPDDCAPPDPRELHKNHGGTCDPFRDRDCEYLATSNTGTITWGIDPYTGQCIKNNEVCTDDGTRLICVEDYSRDQNGRFPADHGKPATHSYAVDDILAQFGLIFPDI